MPVPSISSHATNQPTDQTTASDFSPGDYAAPGVNQFPLALGDFYIFYDDQSRVTPKEKMAYIVMLTYNSENLMLTGLRV